MPKPNQRKEYTAHYNRVERYAALVDTIYKQATDEFTKLALSVGHDQSKAFKWSDYPQTKRRVDQLLLGVSDNIQGVVLNGVTAEWEESNLKNDRLARSVIGIKHFDTDDKGRDIIPERFKPYFNNNADALRSFVDRKQKGLSLSQKVWKLSEQYKSDLELALSVGLSDGRSAAELSRDVRSYLKEPTKLFRRVRSENGSLQLSKAAKTYHPGAGTYRSSYKNAMRLTRTEINMAYRTADSVRWGQMDFVVGFEVKRSGRGYDCSVCETLAGPYPKDFKFVGWHPHCRCYVIPILKTNEEFWAWDGRGEASTSSVNEIKEIPQGYKDWVANNNDRITQAEKRGKLPYFLRDNKKYVNTVAPVMASNKTPITTSLIQQQAAQRHATRTAEQIEDIQSRWDEHKAINYCNDNRLDKFQITDVQSFEKHYLALSKPTLDSWLKAGDDVKAALCDYTNLDFRDINNMCANPELNDILQRKFMPKAAKQMVNIEKFIATTPIERDMIFRRSTTFDEIDGVFGSDVRNAVRKGDISAIGAKGVNKRFSSMSFAENAEFGQSYGNDVEIIYFAPKGTQASYARGFSEVQGVGKGWAGERGEAFNPKAENEFILNTNYTMRISKFEKRDGITRVFIDILFRKKR